MKKPLKVGQVILTTEAPVGNVAQIKRKNYYILSQRVIAFETNKNLSDNFLYFLLQKNKLAMLRYSTGGTAKGISQKSLKQVKIYLSTNIAEQIKISSLINKFENLITLYERKIQCLKKIQQFLLTNIFNYLYKFNTSLTLNNFVNITTGKLDANCMCENGKYDFYTSGIRKYKINSFSFNGPAITVAGNGATVGYLHLADGKFDAYQRTYVINNFHNISRRYVYYMLKFSLPRKIYKESRTGSIPYIVQDMLTTIKVPKLTLEKQNKVSNILKSIDNLVLYNEHIFNNLKQIKKELLDTMFI